MTVSYVERDTANPETLAFYDAAAERSQPRLNIFKADQGIADPQGDAWQCLPILRRPA